MPQDRLTNTAAQSKPALRELARDELEAVSGGDVPQQKPSPISCPCCGRPRNYCSDK